MARNHGSAARRCASGGRFDVDLVPEGLQSTHEASGRVLDGVSSGQPVRAELPEVDPIAYDVVVVPFISSGRKLRRDASTNTAALAWRSWNGEDTLMSG